MDEVFTDEQKTMLNQELDQRLVSDRQGGGNKKLKYIEGHDAIDQANRIFGYGQWGYRPLSCEQVVLTDPLTGEAVGITYKAQVELIVAGCVSPVVEVGSQPVATWNMEEQIMNRRLNDAKYSKPPKPVEEGPFTFFEKKSARAVIMESHEQAEKGAVTDALKRALRTFGDQFGNGLYGDGRVIIDDDQATSSGSEPTSTPQQTRTPSIAGSASQPEQTTTRQPTPFKSAKQGNEPRATHSQPTSTINAPTPNQLRRQCDDLFGANKWEEVLGRLFGNVPPDDNLTPEDCERIKRSFDVVVERRAARQQDQQAS